MKIVRRLFLVLIGFSGVVVFTYYTDPQALDTIGFLAFYILLAVGFCNLFLLLRLTTIQSLLLASLTIFFLLLRQFHLLNLFVGLSLVFGVIIIERYVSLS